MMDATGRMFEALALGRLEKEEEAHAKTRGELWKVEMLLREEWWRNHGCPVTALYGDDGEMQCSACCRNGGVWDFKRTPLADLHVHVVESRRIRVAKVLGDHFGGRDSHE